MFFHHLLGTWCARRALCVVLRAVPIRVHAALSLVVRPASAVAVLFVEQRRTSSPACK